MKDDRDYRSPKVTSNPILDELHTARAKLLADAGGDLQTLVAEVRERQGKSGRKVFSEPVDGVAGGGLSMWLYERMPPKCNNLASPPTGDD